MATETWHYLENQFDNATKTSKKLMYIITSDHFVKLKAHSSDPEIMLLIDRTEPIDVAYRDAYSAWLTERAIYKSATFNLSNRMEELRDPKIKQWNIQIQMHYMEGTNEYVQLLPNGNTPFYTGEYEMRIATLTAFATRLATFPLLAATKTDVDNFLMDINAARNVQQSKESLIADAADQLEILRKDISLMMYKNLGFLINKYGDTPDFIDNFWEISLFRSKPPADNDPSEPIIGVVPPNEVLNLLDGGYDENTMFFISNTGATSLTFCTRPTAVLACSQNHVTLLPGEEITAPASDFGDPMHPYFNVTNNDATTEGSYQLIII